MSDGPFDGLNASYLALILIQLNYAGSNRSDNRATGNRAVSTES